MLRNPMKGTRLSLKTFGQPTHQAAWNGAWRRLFTAQTKDRATSQIWRRFTPAEGVFSRLRLGTTFTGFTAGHGAFRGAFRRGFRFTSRRAAEKGSNATSEQSLSLSARLKKLSKEYGWAAVGVYFALSALDFPFCFLFVRIVGTDRIAQVEHYVVAAFRQVIPESVRNTVHSWWQSLKNAETATLGNDEISDKVEMAGWGIEKATERNKEEASLATQLALAYAIHKSFIFFRVPLTAAVTPKIAKYLRSRGWKIGKRG